MKYAICFHKSIVILLCLFMSMALPIYAQQPTFVLDRSITTIAQCFKDGSIEAVVKTSTPSAFIFEYALTPEFANAPVIPNQDKPLFEFLAAGRYTLTVIGHDPYGVRDDVVRKQEHVEVRGNYREMIADQVPARSRASYISCGTGIIGLQISNGRGPYKYEIISAPNPNYVGRSGTIARAGVTVLEQDDYLPGNYKLTVTDACGYERNVNVTIGTLTAYPKFRIENSNFFTAIANATNTSKEYACDKPLVDIKFDNATKNNVDLRNTIVAGFFEIGIAKPGETPTNWTPFRYETQYAVSIAPYKLSDFYGTRGQLQVYVRLKRCKEIVYSFPAQFNTPSLENPSINNSAKCGYKQLLIKPDKKSSGLFCYPLTVVAKKNDASQDILFGPVTINSVLDKAVEADLPIGAKYIVEVTDAEGVKRANYQGEVKGYFNQRGTKLDFCDGWQINFYPDLVHSCAPVTVDITEKGKSAIIASHTFTSDAPQLSPKLAYNTTYVFHAYLTNNPSVGYVEEKRSYNNNLKPRFGEVIYIIGQTLNLATVNVRDLSADPKTLRLFRDNTLVAETESKGQSTASFNRIELPAGNYRIEIEDAVCGNTIINFTAKGGYELKNFNLATTIDCHGGRVVPNGVISFEGNTNPNNTVFRILSFTPAAGGSSTSFDTKLYKAGETIPLNADGDYVISAHWLPTYNERFTENSLLGTQKVHVSREPLGLSQLDTWAYTCNKRSIGHILVKGKGGSQPYRYELWDKDNKKKLADATYELGANDVAHFEYGASGEQYTIHIIDDCTVFPQAITIADYETYNIGSTPRKVMCIGDVIELRGANLPNYTWRGPQGNVISHEQNVTITDAVIAHSGKYTLEVTMPYCSTPIKGEVEVKVVPCYAPVNPHLMNQAM